MDTSLNKDELKRYARHLILPDFGIKGQEKLKNSKVLLIGAGGLGIPAALYLSAAGVGQIGIVDHDRIELSNLQRQVIYRFEDIGKSKVTTLSNYLRSQNPLINITIHDLYIDSSNAMEIVSAYDLVIDGTDNFPTRYLLNDTCYLQGKPYVYGSIFRFEGQVSVFNIKNDDGSYSPNYRDLFPVPPDPDLVPNCEEGGVIGVLPGIVGTLQALEAIKWISGSGKILNSELLIFDALTMDFRKFKFRSRKDNPISGLNPSISELIDYVAFCNNSNKSKDSFQNISADKLKSWIETKKEFQLIDVREEHEYMLENISAELMPLSDFQQYIEKIRMDIPVVFHCKSGSRSRKAIRKLLDLDIKGEFYNLEGGIDQFLDNRTIRNF